MMKRIVAAILLSFMVFLAVPVPMTHGQTMDPDQPMVRLHVVADANDAQSQARKLLVRDAVLRVLDADMRRVDDVWEAEACVAAHLDEICVAAQEALAQDGCADCSVTAQVQIETFPSIVYNGQIVPAGNYTALRVVIGRGQGRNWWCVLFPPLCYADVHYDETQQSEQVEQPVEIRWFVQEWLSDLMVQNTQP